MPIEYCKWDSEFFDLKVGRFNLDTIQDGEFDFKQITEYDLVYVISDVENKSPELEIPNTHYISFSDIKVDFEWRMTEMSDSPTAPVEVTIYNGNSADDDLLNLAYQAGQHSRFRQDSNFGQTVLEKLYGTWIRKSVKGQYDSKVYVISKDSRAVALVTIKEGDEDGFDRIGLIAVHADYRGRGFGKLLIDQVKYNTICNKHGCFRVTTQKTNTGAMNFYQRQGCLPINAIKTAHIWRRGIKL